MVTWLVISGMYAFGLLAGHLAALRGRQPADDRTPVPAPAALLPPPTITELATW